jgi:hypothetical protein
MSEENNSAKGRDSFDIQIGDLLVPFFNRNVSEYPTEAGSQKFDLVPITKQKDVMINIARLHAQQEYDRIMDLARVLQKQAEQIKRRLEITDAVHSAEYQFILNNGHCYWLVWDNRKTITRLVMMGPNDWSCGKPIDYDYISRVKYLGDHTWIEVNENGEPIK